jgi:hypothetical protein
MTFKLDHQRIEELVQLEEELNCDISAGTKLNSSLGQPSFGFPNYIDNHKLTSLLQNELGGILSEGEIGDLAQELQNQIRHRVSERQASTELK